MKISLSPQRRDDKLTVIKNGDKLRINDVLYNFGPLPEGATAQAVDIECDWLTGTIERINGELELTLILPHGANPSQAVAFPEPLVDVPDGDVALPFDPEPEPPATPDAEELTNVDD